jgi:hypothetical protein
MNVYLTLKLKLGFFKIIVLLNCDLSTIAAHKNLLQETDHSKDKRFYYHMKNYI